MDWLRRNWPDLIIGVALIAVIAGIVATLLSGGSFLSFGGQLGGGNRAEQPPTVQGSQNAGQEAEQDSGQNAGQNAGSSATPSSDTANNDSQQDSGIEPVVPDLPGSGADAPNDAPDNAAGNAPANEPAPTQDASTDADTDADTDASTSEQAAEQANDSSATNDATSPNEAEDIQSPPAAEGGSYRVSVGAFSSSEGAQSLTETYSAQGLPTFVASQGDLSLALIGPYESEEEANRVAQQIIEGGGDAIVYNYEPTAGEVGAGASGSSQPADTAQNDAAPTQGESQDQAQEDSGAADTATDTTTDTTATTDTAADTDTSTAAADTAATNEPLQSGTFLQAGAFGSLESAEPTRERIEELGYTTSESGTGTGLIRLFVGPLGPSEIDEAQAQLQALGIDNFPVSIP